MGAQINYKQNKKTKPNEKKTIRYNRNGSSAIIIFILYMEYNTIVKLLIYKNK